MVSEHWGGMTHAMMPCLGCHLNAKYSVIAHKRLWPSLPFPCVYIYIYIAMKHLPFYLA